jgi:hypothetical protein
MAWEAKSATVTGDLSTFVKDVPTVSRWISRIKAAAWRTACTAVWTIGLESSIMDIPPDDKD